MKILNILLAVCFITLISCGGDSKKGTTEADGTTTEVGSESPTFNVTGAPDGSGLTPSTPPTAEPPQNTDGVWHYTCPKGCAGGGGSAAPCPKCGATLAHNQAYHGQPNATPTPTPAGAAGAVTTPPPAEPPQNAKGVWHYTCSKGCAGGAGSATACAKCGNTLAHNAVYHQ